MQPAPHNTTNPATTSQSEAAKISEAYSKELALKLAEKLEKKEIALDDMFRISADFLSLLGRQPAPGEAELKQFIAGI